MGELQAFRRAARRVFDALGPGHEKVHYARALALALGDEGVMVELDAPFELRFDGQSLGKRRVDVVSREVAAVLDVEGRPRLAHARTLARVSGRRRALVLGFAGPALAVEAARLASASAARPRRRRR